jgi:hypothetical protein
MANKRTTLAKKNKNLHLRNRDLVCPNCGEPNSPDTDFCESCGVPLGNMAATDPVKSIRSAAWAYRRIFSGPPSSLILVGVWVMLGPWLPVVPLIMAYQIANDASLGIGGLLELSLEFLWLVLCGLLLYRITTNYWSHPRKT